MIDEFIALGFGRPKLEITVEDGVISHAALKRDAPCGYTWYVAKKLNWTDVADYKETASSAHHAYPCTASMDRDTELASGWVISYVRLWRKGWGMKWQAEHIPDSDGVWRAHFVQIII